MPATFFFSSFALQAFKTNLSSLSQECILDRLVRCDPVVNKKIKGWPN